MSRFRCSETHFVLAISLCLAACTNDSASAANQELNKVRSGTVPVDARLLKDSGPVCDGSEIRDDWQIQINSETHDYVASLKTKLSDYHVVSESGSSTTFVQDIGW